MKASLMAGSISLVAAVLLAGCGGGNSDKSTNKEADASFCQLYASACDGITPRVSLDVGRSFVRGDEGCYETDFDTKFPQRGGQQIVLCGANWTKDDQGFPNPGQIRCYGGAQRLDDGQGNWPTACDAANVGVVGKNPQLWHQPLPGVSQAKTTVAAAVQQAAKEEAERFGKFSAEEKAAYQRGYRHCQTLVKTGNYTGVGTYVSSHNVSNDPVETELAAGCSDANSETPLLGSGFTVPSP